MLSTHDLRRRIRSVSSTAQITRAMQMVAASKMRKAQQAVLAGRPFGRLLYRIQREATTQAVTFTHPLLEVRPVRKRAVILVSPNQGLCGGLNTNLFHLAVQFEPETTIFVTAGRKATEFVAHNGRQLGAEFTYADTPRFAEARAIADFARDLFLKRAVDQVQIVATRFINTLTQQATSIEFLPIGPIQGLKIEGVESEDQLKAHASEFLFEPSAQAVLSYLLPHYLNLYLYGVLLNARASEQSARMVSMKNATENANNLIKDLTLDLNRQRQGTITNELLDIAAGQAESA
jgi:F-type H+-transporting ATPase subunit gamma